MRGDSRDGGMMIDRDVRDESGVKDGVGLGRSRGKSSDLDTGRQDRDSYEEARSTSVASTAWRRQASEV